MLRRRLMKKVMYMPFRKIGKSLTNIVVFDLAMNIYTFLKAKILTVERQEARDKEIVNDDFMSGLKNKKRRW